MKNNYTGSMPPKKLHNSPSVDDRKIIFQKELKFHKDIGQMEMDIEASIHNDI